MTTAIEQGFSQIVVRAHERAAFASLGRFECLWRDGPADGNGALKSNADAASTANHATDKTEPHDHTGPRGTDETVWADDGEHGRWITIHDKDDEARISALAGKVANVVVTATDWKIIPMENLIADYQPTHSSLLAEVASADDARLMLDTLQVGTDGIVLRPRHDNGRGVQTIIDLRRLIDGRGTETVRLEEATIVSVRDGGTGDRVCVDTCSLLRPGEGMLVGSSSKGLLLVHSESLESEYVNARPFRVNAGAVHAYVLAPRGRTHYLSEVKAGLPLLAVDHKGETRTVSVGRAKVETRPLLVVEARPADDASAPTFNVVVQNAETIRFVTPGGGALSVTEARPGDTVLLARFDSARHFGRAIDEDLTER